MGPEEQAAKYAWEARRFLWLTNHIMRLGQTGSFVDDMQAERERLRRTVPAQYIKDAIKEGKGVNEKGFFHNQPRVFYNGDESVSDQYWHTHPKGAAERARVLEVEHDRWLPPKRQEELRKERKERDQKELREKEQKRKRERE